MMASAFNMFKILLLFALISLAFAGEVDEGQERELETRGSRRQLEERIIKLEKKIKKLVAHQAFVLRGRDGRDGMQGKPGKDGRDGENGEPGPQGPPGPKGNTGPKGVQGSPGNDAGGLQYVRWGKTSCNSGAELVYKGRVGSGHYSHSGGGANYICLTESPQWLKPKHGSQGGSYIYGTEYETGQFGGALFGKNLHDLDAPCAVCYVKTRNAKMMLPGAYNCPAGWSREYYGYLMNDHYNHRHSSEYICVDHDADGVHGTRANLNGALLYPVESHCGALPCPPYIQGNEVTCAVCTK